MVRSSTASYEVNEQVRNMAQQNVGRLQNVTNAGLFGVRDLAQHGVEQTREAFLGFLSTTQKSLASFDQQSSDLRQTTLSLATKVMSNSFELAQNLLRARSAQEIVQVQTEFAESQMRAFAEQTRAFGMSFVEQGREFGQVAARTATEAMRNAGNFAPKEVGGEEGK